MIDSRRRAKCLVGVVLDEMADKDVGVEPDYLIAFATALAMAFSISASDSGGPE